MSNTEFTELSAYSELNRRAVKGGAVLFGSSFASRIPFSELAEDFAKGTPGYNRSVAGLSLANAESCLEECVYALEPSKLFLCFGDNESAPADEYILCYEKLLYRLRMRLPQCDIYVVSAVPEAHGYDSQLASAAADAGCRFINTDDAAQHESLLDRLRCLMRTRPMSFFDAINA